MGGGNKLETSVLYDSSIHSFIHSLYQESTECQVLRCGDEPVRTAALNCLPVAYSDSPYLSRCLSQVSS